MIVSQSEWPKWLLKFDEVKGVSYRTCIRTGEPLRKGAAAHAHCRKTGERYGWICIPFKSRIKNKMLMLHEVAHLIAGKEVGHGKEWRKICLSLGGTTSSYRITKSKVSRDRNPMMIKVILFTSILRSIIRKSK